MTKSEVEHINRILAALHELRTGQLAIIERIANQLREPYILIERWKDSDLINECLLYHLGDHIRVHHSLSKEAFTKGRFEYALESALNYCGIKAQLAPRGNPGHDITIKDIPVSLKTQADRSIRAEVVHISKWMELGKGTWSSSVDDLVGLREQFFHHLTAYERIFVLRGLSDTPQKNYELVEIPKSLLLEAEVGVLRIQQQSSQNPKPGYCDIFGSHGELKYQLYFDFTFR